MGGLESHKEARQRQARSQAQASHRRPGEEEGRVSKLIFIGHVPDGDKIMILSYKIPKCSALLSFIFMIRIASLVSSSHHVYSKLQNRLLPSNESNDNVILVKEILRERKKK